MLEREKDNHKGCPNYSFCKKDESKCCYISKRSGLLDNDNCEDYL